MTNLLLYIALAATIVAVLAILRGRLVFELSATSLLLFGRSEPGIVLYTVLMLPGTIIHELSHWLVAEILRVPTGKITILPSNNEEIEGSQNLGSVATGTTDPFRGLLIGGAPFATGIAILIVLSTLARDWWGIHPWWHLALVIYGLIVIGNSMIVSSSDRRNWPIAIGVIILLFVVLWQLGMRPTPELIEKLTSAARILLFVLLLTTSINLGTIGICASFRRVIERLSHKQVIRQ